MSRGKLLSLQLLVAVVAIALWHVLTTVPFIGSVKLLPPFFFSTPVDVAARIVEWFVEGTIWHHLWITLIEVGARFRGGVGCGRADRLLVRPQAARGGGVRPLREDDQRAAAHRAGADLRALARPRHLVEGGARRHAGVLHRVLQRLSGRQGGEPHRARQCAHAGDERAAADAARLLALGAVLDVFFAAHLRRLCRGRRGGGRISRLGRGARLSHPAGRGRLRRRRAYSPAWWCSRPS